MSDDLTTESDKPVAFREVFATRGFRALYLANTGSMLGDYLARAAVTVLVYQQSESPLLAAAAFAVSYLPWIVGGPLLAALAERYPYRRVLIVCDLARMVLIGSLLVPDLPLPVMLLVLFLVALGNPPAQAAGSALLPLLLDRRQLPSAISVSSATAQSMQVIGYVAGAGLATAVSPRAAIAIDVLTFAVSAALVWTRVHPPAAQPVPERRRHLLREAGEGFRLVFGTRTLRLIALVVFAGSAFTIVPEGLAVAWAAEGDPTVSRGLDQGLIMAAGPIGVVIGSLIAARLLRPSLRDRLVRPLAVVAPLVLVPALLAPPAPVVALLVLASGVCQGGLFPTLNAKFVLALPHGYRARAFGVILQGVQLSQGAAVLLTGILAERAAVPVVVGAWCLGGTVLMAVLVLRWRAPGEAGARVPATAGAGLHGVRAVTPQNR